MVIDYELDESVARIYLNRPHRLNAVVPELTEGLIEGLGAGRSRRGQGCGAGRAGPGVLLGSRPEGADPAGAGAGDPGPGREDPGCDQGDPEISRPGYRSRPWLCARSRLRVRAGL